MRLWRFYRATVEHSVEIINSREDVLQRLIRHCAYLTYVEARLGDRVLYANEILKDGLRAMETVESRVAVQVDKHFNHSVKVDKLVSEAEEFVIQVADILPLIACRRMCNGEILAIFNNHYANFEGFCGFVVHIGGNICYNLHHQFLAGEASLDQSRFLQERWAKLMMIMSSLHSYYRMVADDDDFLNVTDLHVIHLGCFLSPTVSEEFDRKNADNSRPGALRTNDLLQALLTGVHNNFLRWKKDSEFPHKGLFVIIMEEEEMFEFWDKQFYGGPLDALFKVAEKTISASDRAEVYTEPVERGVSVFGIMGECV